MRGMGSLYESAELWDSYDMSVLQKKTGTPEPVEDAADVDASGPGSDSTGRPGARTRMLRYSVTAVVVVLALLGAHSAWNWVTGGPPGVGHFRSAEGREAYLAAYQETFEALPEPSSTREVDVAHGTLRVYEWSRPDTEDEVPILLLAGRSSGAPMWSQNLEALAAEHPVHAVDPLGDAGMSVQGVPFASFDDQAEYLDELLAEIAPDGAHLVGHSFGARLAISVAQQHPEDVRSLTLLEPAMAFAWPPAGMLFWSGIAFLPGLPDSVTSRALSEIGGEPYDPEDPMARMIEAGSEHYRAALPQPAVLTEDEISALDVPTYVAIGDHSSLAGGEEAVEAARALPDATVEVWEDTTHSLPMQAGERLDRTILEHLRSHG